MMPTNVGLAIPGALHQVGFPITAIGRHFEISTPVVSQSMRKAKTLLKNTILIQYYINSRVIS